MTMPRIMLLVLVLNTLIAVGGVVFNYQLVKPLLAASQAAKVSAPVLGEDGKPVEAAPAAEAAEEEVEPAEYAFFPVTKIIVSLQGKDREHYFIVDLVLQANLETEQKKLQQIDPMVRNSAVAYLSALKFDELRGKPIPELQVALEQALLADFATKKIVAPFEHVLVSKLIVQ
ncbi:flagellar basal body-associated FliL family protein [Pseudomonas sp. UL073]|uniref:Flagellar protein FliL n=1 Tax=Zestomonas insulae TaxID=2809017 RepID=A0ABS2IAG1_9GAMM|nr:flagellar basal body-associated FliL family protein [Pseudomonas insulae]MBM7059138.1 flagellar basal body-associated FliL family protein [Pseudomonas insulae]